MKRVYIAQCLCPQRHCIVSAVNEAETRKEAEALIPWLREKVDELMRSGSNPWCGICQAPKASWRIEIGRTAWSTMEEAAPHLAKNELEMVVTGIVFGELLGTDRKAPAKPN